MSSPDLRFARGVASEAGGLLKAGAFRGHAAASKRNPGDLVTEYDRRSEALIVKAIRAAYPDDAIIAEESGSHLGPPVSDRRWLVDPLDGTVNFAHGLPLFCVSIALEAGGDLLVGVVEAPALGWSFYAERGGGAWCDGRRLQVSATDTLDASLLATGFPYDRKTSPQNNFAEFVAIERQAHGVRRPGAAALDLAMVAAGWFDGYWEYKLKPWDVAAGALLVTEAGGRITSPTGGPFVVDDAEAAATNGRIHAELLGALAAVPR